jgi:hypothetical protein
MKITFNAMRFVFILFFLGVYQVQADVYSKKVDFDSTSGWRLDTVGTGSRAIFLERGSCCGGWVAHLNVSGAAGGWSAVGREFKFPSRTLSGKSISSAVLWAGSSVTVNMEVIDPTTWRYIAVATHKGSFGVPQGAGAAIPFPSFTVPSKSVYFRVALTGAGSAVSLDVDQMTFSAQY